MSATLSPTQGSSSQPTPDSYSRQFESDSGTGSTIQPEAPAGRRPRETNAAAPTGETPRGAVRFRSSVRPAGAGQLDALLLERGGEVLEDVELSSPEEMTIALESLRCVACELWNSADSASQFHQSILALVESLLRDASSLSGEQAVALRGAFMDLSNHSLTIRHVEVTRSRFIEVGYNPLGILSGVEAPNDEERQT